MVKGKNIRRARKGTRGRRPYRIHDIPPLVTVTKVTRTYRFAASNVQTDIPIYNADILGIAGAVCTVANSTLNYLAQSFQIHRIRMWVPSATAGATVTGSLKLASLNNTPAMEISANAASTARPGFLEVVPGKGTYLEMAWGFQASIVTMTITCPAGTIFDVHATHWLADTGASVGTFTVAAGTLGVLYYLPLDGDTDVLVPIGLPTTT